MVIIEALLAAINKETKVVHKVQKNHFGYKLVIPHTNETVLHGGAAAGFIAMLKAYHQGLVRGKNANR